MRTICGTHKYLAPELVQCDRGQLQGYDKAIDMCAPAPSPNLHTLLIPPTCAPLPSPQPPRPTHPTSTQPTPSLGTRPRALARAPL